MSNSSSPSNKPSIRKTDWYAIACKIRTQNQKLKQKIINLETLLDEQKEQIKVQVLKNQDYEELISEQEETRSLLEAEISEYEEQISEKTQQIESQQSNINQLTQELQKIQQQTARLERECSLLQENYHDEQNKLKQREAENKDLRIRLQRQQRYNLQYKTALDKFLDTSSQNNRDFNSLGIKSWSEDNSSNEDDNFGLNFGNISDTWNNEAPTHSENEAQINQTESLDSENEGADVENNLEQEVEEDEQAQEKNGRSKLFLKLPQFGSKKKNEQ